MEEVRRAFVVVGMGYGDEGKGSAVHWLACRHRARTVVRTGGPQAFHRVVASGGGEHVFSQLGAGTFAGASTHLSRNMVIDPDAILNEGRALAYEQGIRNIFDFLTIHEDALVITPFQAIANRVRELARGPRRHGSVGIGVGEAVLDARTLGEGAVRARDLASPALPAKLEAIRDLKLREMQAAIDGSEHLAGAPLGRAREEMEKLADPETLAWAVERFGEAARRARIVDTQYFTESILGAPGCVVFEGSQGALLDPVHGFAPYTTQVRTIPEAAHELIHESGYAGEVATLGAIRAYHTRHGPGPFVTESATLTEMLPDPSNRDHPWQGGFRVGALDFVALRHAITACGGPPVLDGLIVSCVDRIHELGDWQTCDAYTDATGARVSSLCKLGGVGSLAERLMRCEADLSQRPIPASTGAAAFAVLCAETIREKTGVRVIAASLGPTESDKIDL